MKYAHSVKLAVFCYQNENEESIFKALIDFFPYDLEKNKIRVNTKKATGFHESKIKIFEVIVAKESLVNQLLQSIVSKSTEGDKNTILSQLESRIDKELDFFMRFNKYIWTDSRKLVLTDSGKCFHFKISLAAFPKKREIAKEIARKIFE